MTTYDSARPEGHPSWFDLMTPDVGAVTDFYRQLFGWSYRDSGPDFGNYHMALTQERNAAGIGEPPEGSDAPPAWTVYYATDDADATTARAAELGATVLSEPFEVPGQGRMSIVQDPTGAVFGLWQPLGHIGAGIADAHGAMTWCEVNTRDAERALAFYCDLFDATSQPLDAGGSTYHMLRKGDTSVGGILQMDENWEGVPAHWMPYFSVDDVEGAVRTAEEAGGKVSVRPFDTAYGRIAVLNDPAGAVFSVVQPNAAP